MGYTSTGGTKGLGVFNDTPSTVADLNQLRDLIARQGNFRVETTGSRDAIPAGQLYEGLTIYNSTSKSVETYTGSGWLAIYAPDVDDQVASSPNIYGAGWTDYTTFGWAGVRYWRRGRVVYVNGAAAKSSWATGEAILTLPVGFRPSRQVQAANCTVLTSGAVTAAAAGTVAVSLGAVFPV
jgi:hypothetical protein